MYSKTLGDTNITETNKQENQTAYFETIMSKIMYSFLKSTVVLSPIKVKDIISIEILRIRKDKVHIRYSEFILKHVLNTVLCLGQICC